MSRCDRCGSDEHSHCYVVYEHGSPAPASKPEPCPHGCDDGVIEVELPSFASCESSVNESRAYPCPIHGEPEPDAAAVKFTLDEWRCMAPEVTWGFYRAALAAQPAFTCSKCGQEADPAVFVTCEECEPKPQESGFWRPAYERVRGLLEEADRIAVRALGSMDVPEALANDLRRLSTAIEAAGIDAALAARKEG